MSTTSSPQPPQSAAGPPSSDITTRPYEAPRKFPAPCWTQEETLALINAYRDKWYSLRRRNLRSTDWDAVAADVAIRCPVACPAKSSAQCRHKMEKLRKRYRTEKQRALSLPGHHCFSSSWNFYDLMDSMETGSSVNNNNDNNDGYNIGSVLNSQNGYSSKVVKNQSSSKARFSKIDEILKGNNSLKDEFGGSTGKTAAMPVPIKVKIRSHGSPVGCDSNLADDDDEYDDEEFGFRSSGYGLKSPYSNTKDSNYGTMDTGYGSRNFDGKNSMLTKNMGKSDASCSTKLDPKNLSGVHKRSDGGVDCVEAKRGMDPVVEMASSIKMLGDGFVKMEKMKIEMVREIESMRMEMEMKRSEMILESQQHIVNTFVDGLTERKKRKVSVME